MKKIANPTRTRQADLDNILDTPDPRQRSHAILEHTRWQMEESHARIRVMLLEACRYTQALRRTDFPPQAW